MNADVCFYRKTWPQVGPDLLHQVVLKIESIAGPACTPILISNPAPLLNYKTPHNLMHPRLRHTVFEGTSLQCPPLSDKAIKLFVSTSLKTLSPRFDSALAYRSQVFAIDNDTDGRQVWWRQNETQKQRLIYFTFKISILENIRHACKTKYFLSKK